MKLLVVIILLCGIQHVCEAQTANLQRGSYLCTSRRIETWNNDTQKYDITSDWVNLPAQSIAFRVVPDSVIYYTEGQPGKAYKTRQPYRITALKAMPDIDSFADTEFRVTQNGLNSLITIRLLSGYEGYAGQIKVADGLVQSHFSRLITYTFTRSEDVIK